MDRINEFQPNEFRSVVDRWGSLMVVGRAHGSVAVPESLRGSAAVRIWALGTPGVTGGVRWDSGVVLGKFLEHSVDSGMLVFQGNNIVELGSGCGWVGDSLNSRLVLTGEENKMNEGDNNNQISPPTVLGSDVVYSEGDVLDLLETLVQLSGPNTTIFLAGELRNDAILEYFLEAATDNFTIGRLDQKLWHPDNCSNRVVRYVLLKK
ncbi:hypothetical protein JHK82_025323 [Glycine max]|nr:hypothetical protein JHK82_025323 [Glycine max]